MNATLCSSRGRQRTLFALAGTMTLLSVVLTLAVDPLWALLAGLVAINQLVFASVGACPASIVLGRLCTQEAG